MSQRFTLKLIASCALLFALMLVTYVPAFSLWLPGLVLTK